MNLRALQYEPQRSDHATQTILKTFIKIFNNQKIMRNQIYINKFVKEKIRNTANVSKQEPKWKPDNPLHPECGAPQKKKTSQDKKVSLIKGRLIGV